MDSHDRPLLAVAGCYAIVIGILFAAAEAITRPTSQAPAAPADIRPA